MLKYYDTDIPFDETTLIPPLNNNKYYMNLEEHLDNITHETTQKKEKKQSSCLPICFI